MAVSASFRFSRINRWVFFPRWADLVSHDVPFADGFSGEIALKITAKTPLLVGGKRSRYRDSQPNQPGKVFPYAMPDGTPAIPGSSLQGLIRGVLEVAGFGKLGPVVAERRFGMRDLSRGKTAEQAYRKLLADGNGTHRSIRPKSQAGWLRRGADGKPEIVPCEYGRITFADIAQHFEPEDADRRQNLDELLARTGRYGNDRGEVASKDAPARYNAILGVGAHDYARLDLQVSVANHWVTSGGHGPQNNLSIDSRPCRLSLPGPTEVRVNGTLVVTGKPSTGNAPNSGKKHREFVFFGPNRSDASGTDNGLHLSDRVWRDFQAIHAPDPASGQTTNPNWQFWEREFAAGLPIPVFYLKNEEGNVSKIGMAQMFKLAMSLSTHDMLKHSNVDHIDDRKRFDLASLIFGATGGEGGKESWFGSNLKRRASFDTARSNSGGDGSCIDAVLLSPKPNYYPIYVRQAVKPNNTIPNNEPYATYHPMEGPDRARTNPELAGVKIWPMRQVGEVGLVSTHVERADARLRQQLHFLPAQTEFTTTLRVHNLRVCEVGALIWALTQGTGNTGVHRIGMGKPLNAGLIEITVEGMSLLPNRDAIQIPDVAEFVATFESTMQKAYATRSPGKEWSKSPQVIAVKTASSPGTDTVPLLDMAAKASGQGQEGYVKFREERLAGRFLGDYVDSTHEIGFGGATTVQQELLPNDELIIGQKYKSGTQVGRLVHFESNVVFLDLGNGRTRVRFARLGLEHYEAPNA